MRPAVIIASMFACSCGLSEEHYQSKLISKICDAYFSCEDELDGPMAYDDRADFEDQLDDDVVTIGDDADCAYHEDEAKACLKAFDEVDCDDVAEGTYPKECDEVYTGTCGGDTQEGGGADGGGAGGDPGGGGEGGGNGGGGNGGP